MIRLFIKDSLYSEASIEIKDDSFHYLKNVMRKGENDEILLFNGTEGEWLGKIVAVSKKSMQIIIDKQTKEQETSAKIHLYFALIKKDNVDLVVEKATELNVAKITPIITEHTITSKTNIDRLKLIAIEASEQCERTNIPEIFEPLKFDTLLNNMKNNEDTTFFIMDETGMGKKPKDAFPPFINGKVAFIIGPEGGFSKSEFAKINTIKNVCRVSMGKNILRAETATIVAISAWHSICGDFI